MIEYDYESMTEWVIESMSDLSDELSQWVSLLYMTKPGQKTR